MSRHQDECVYRLVSCPDLGCKLIGPFHKLLLHVDFQNHWCNTYSVTPGQKLDFDFEFIDSVTNRLAPFKINFDNRSS